MDIREKSRRLYGSSVVIDALGNAPFTDRARYFDKLVEAGVTAAVVTATRSYDNPLDGVRRLKEWYDVFDEQSERVVSVSTSLDVGRAKREAKVGVILETQNADILGDDLSLLPAYKRLGLRIIQPCYYAQNLLGEGCGERTNSGLSNFGIEVIREMSRLGLLADVSHCGDQVTTDAIEYSSNPILITHSNPRGMVNHIRNKTDEHIKALASKGGVIGLAAFSPFCEVRGDVRPTLEDFLDIVDYAVRLVGPDYVALGLDLNPFMGEERFDTFTRMYPGLKPRGGYLARTIFTDADGLDDLNRIPEIVDGLIARGYPDGDIEKILGLNFLRVFKEVCG